MKVPTERLQSIMASCDTMALTHISFARSELAALASELLELREAVKAQTEALTFYRDEFKPKIHKKQMPGASNITFHPSEALLEDCGNRATIVLAARSLQSHNTGEET